MDQHRSEPNTSQFNQHAHVQIITTSTCDEITQKPTDESTLGNVSTLGLNVLDWRENKHPHVKPPKRQRSVRMTKKQPKWLQHLKLPKWWWLGDKCTKSDNVHASVDWLVGLTPVLGEVYSGHQPPMFSPSSIGVVLSDPPLCGSWWNACLPSNSKSSCVGVGWQYSF